MLVLLQRAFVNKTMNKTVNKRRNNVTRGSAGVAISHSLYANSSDASGPIGGDSSMGLLAEARL